MSTTANFDGSICGLCKVKINKGEEIENHGNAWCHTKCVKAQGSASTPTTEYVAPNTPKDDPDRIQDQPKKLILDPAPALVDFVYQENKTLLEIEGIITEQHKQLGIPFNGQQIGMRTREIYLQAKKTNLLKASQIK